MRIINTIASILLAILSLAIVVTGCGSSGGSGGGSKNTAPVADAGSDKTVVSGFSTQLDGRDSSDANNDHLTYSWTLTGPAGSNATLSDVSSATPAFIPDITGDYTATLIVNDGKADSTPDSVVFTAVLPNFAFGTSEVGDGDLSSWTSSGSNTGLAAADAVCNTLASNAGLPGTYVAWISDDNDDAYCRIHGLTGKKGNCIPANPSTPVGPWIRTDGFPFGDSIDELLFPTGKIYAPLYFDENGNALPISSQYYTATDREGKLETFNGNCTNWTVNSSTSVARGDANRTTDSWTYIGSTSCDSSIHHLICFQMGSGDSLPSLVSSGKKVFVTSVQGRADLFNLWQPYSSGNGIGAGDEICQSLATDAGLANASRFKAWLSDASTNAIDRLTSNGPWVRVDGVKVANSKADLIGGQLIAPINVTETGAYLGNSGTYTGTDSIGMSTGNHCDNWSDLTVSFNATRGIANSINGWTGSSMDTCNGAGHIYCFED